LSSDEPTAYQVRKVVKSVTGGDFSEGSTVTVSGGLKYLLTYVWLAVDAGVADGAVDALASAEALPPLLQPAAASRSSALTAAMTASRPRVTGIFLRSCSSAVRLIIAIAVMPVFLLHDLALPVVAGHRRGGVGGGGAQLVAAAAGVAGGGGERQEPLAPVGLAQPGLAWATSRSWLTRGRPKRGADARMSAGSARRCAARETAAAATRRLSCLRSFWGCAGLGEPCGFHEPFAGDAELVAGMDDGRPGGAAEQAQHQVVGGEQQRAKVGDAGAWRAGSGPGVFGDLLEVGTGQ